MEPGNLQETVENIGDWVVRTRQPPGEGPHPVLLLLHGWTGDENSMWIFASRLPEDAYLIAPRGLYRTKLGGYGWQAQGSHFWPSVDDFHPAIERLLHLLQPKNFPGADLKDLRIAGFSQGAALTYTIALLHPHLVRSLAGLSGFLPGGVSPLVEGQPLRGKAVFVAHGTQDERVPVEKARHAVQVLETAGARVSYCEDDVGHKLSLTCFKGLEAFFED